ncbi:MAG: bifunctional diaminohydroxyphosphoribosylaminopyrimidine deaminase/5-amino-6-(5-phosphoribosylamino)uracil reductase RibD [Ferruginibacter sp.]
MLNFTRLNNHETYMQRCLQLAQLGEGNVMPNPMVGAVLVHKGIVIGEGYHQQYGQAHAEVNCINNVKEANKHLISQSTLYVSLEPCNHFGKTPPCADLIIKHQIPEVIIACTDPFEKVNGSGIKKLQDAGIKVLEGILNEEAIELNKRFFTFHKKQRPYIILKWAQSNNLKIADQESKAVKITNEITDRLVHKWRSEEAAILVGTNTALNDNPALTTRLWPGKNPVRIVIDRQLKLPQHLQLFDGSIATIVINNIKKEENENTILYKIAKKENLPTALMNLLYRRQLSSLIVEGGAALLQSFIDAGLWDEARIITNNDLIIENGIEAPDLKNNKLINTEQVLTDSIRFYSNKNI